VIALCLLVYCFSTRSSDGPTVDTAGSVDYLGKGNTAVTATSGTNPSAPSAESPPDSASESNDPAISLSGVGLDIIRATAFDVYDGDTFHVMIDGTDEKVRVTGVDTPEIGSTDVSEAAAAVLARDFTADLVEGKTVYLVSEHSALRDQYGRFLAYVWLSRPPDTLEEARADVANTLNGKLLSGGYATTMTIEPNTTFADELAKLAGNSHPKTPPLVTAQPSQSTGENDSELQKGPGTAYYIKGNISVRTGEKIYHMPGQRYYDETIIDESQGERWFSSEEEAQAAGWRKSKV
jgi:micrococcal nuclease